MRKPLAALVCSALASTLLCSTARAQATQYPGAPPVLLGAAWYPEQWPESQWEPDLARMEAAHIHLVRVGEFAWSTMEPTEGNWQWQWLDRAIAAAAKHHIVVVLGTPTAAPPAWLTEKYPQTLRIDNQGRRDEHGNRQQFSFSDAKYRELARDVAARMAERYGNNPDVVGWQIDNELAASSFDDEAKQQFHAWLKAKYGTIDALNQRWWTSYWSQSYNDFNQVPVHDKEENPALLLDWDRFVTDTWVAYTQNQVTAIRAHADKRQFITTNTMGWFDGFNAYKEHEGLDIAAWDDYISTDHFDWADNAARHDLTRGYKQRNFWVMETEPAFVNWRKTNTPLEKGQTRELAWQAIAHGADAVEYWQWRAALNGQEEYHGVLVGANGMPAPVYEEIAQVGKEFEQAGAALSGTTPVAQVALINDFDSRWAIDFQRHNQQFSPVAEMVDFYRPLHQGAQGVDVIGTDAPLAKYKLVVAPGPNVLPQAEADKLLAWVRAGGNLLLGPRSGMKNFDDGLDPHQQPGPLAEALGAHVSQFYALDQPVPVTMANSPAVSYRSTANIWAETLATTAPDTQTLATYGPSNGWLDAQPAVVARKVGKGSITYVGAWLDEASLKHITNLLLQQSGVTSIVPDVPADVEVNLRSGPKGSVLVLINHGTAPATVTLPPSFAAHDLLAPSASTSGSVTLPKYGVAVLQVQAAH
ncbi:beta-galactosidase [Acidipila sp. EB88]|uniref:beta-galactosidase n=1 Tax=Acidipila sp. EB88 TaxID=2305226 RepID=UPI001F3D7FC4|nr:beta-galactosidase [Acidipila sp. EB88]